MRLTGACARIVMGVWGRKVKEIFEKESIQIWLSAAYVDDVRTVTPVIEKGRRWQFKEKKFLFKDEWKEQDEELDESDQQRTSKEVENAMNSIFKHIQFEMEIPAQFENNKLPTLDFNMWLEKGERKDADPEKKRELILYSFYEKKVGSPFCVMESTAMSENGKNSCLSQDLVRRMMNTSEMVPQQERNEIVETYIKKLTVSGYNEKQVKNIIESGLSGYERKLEKSRRECQELHRASKSTLAKRHRKKLTEKSGWFRKKKGGDLKISAEGTGKKRRKGLKAHTSTCKPPRPTESLQDQQPVTVLFVARTPGGELARRLRQAEAELAMIMGDKVKIVEKSGKMLKSILHRPNPMAGENCQRPNCLVCSHGGEEARSNCRQRNVSYRTDCLECKIVGKEAFYLGESSRTAFERGVEHNGDFETEKEDSHMFKHQIIEHGDLERKVKFSMKVLRSHKSAFHRQIHEAVIIEMNETKNLLNSKSEYSRCRIPRLSVMIGENEVKNKSDKEKREKIGENDCEKELEERNFRKRKDEKEKMTQEPARKRKRRYFIQEKKPEKRKRENYENSRLANIEVSKKQKTEELAECDKNESMVRNMQESQNLQLECNKVSSKPKENVQNLITLFNKIAEKNLKIKNQSVITKTFKFQGSVNQDGEKQKLRSSNKIKRKPNCKNKAHHSHSPANPQHLQLKKQAAKSLPSPAFKFKPMDVHFNPVKTINSNPTQPSQSKD